VLLRAAPGIYLEEQMEVLQFSEAFYWASPGCLPAVHTAFFLCIFSGEGVLSDFHHFGCVLLACADSF